MPLCTTPPRVWEGGGGQRGAGEYWVRVNRISPRIKPGPAAGGCAVGAFSAEETRNFFTLRSVALWMEAAPPFGRGWPHADYMRGF